MVVPTECLDNEGRKRLPKEHSKPRDLATDEHVAELHRLPHLYKDAAGFLSAPPKKEGRLGADEKYDDAEIQDYHNDDRILFILLNQPCNAPAISS